MSLELQTELRYSIHHARRKKLVWYETDKDAPVKRWVYDTNFGTLVTEPGPIAALSMILHFRRSSRHPSRGLHRALLDTQTTAPRDQIFSPDPRGVYADTNLTWVRPHHSRDNGVRLGDVLSFCGYPERLITRRELPTVREIYGGAMSTDDYLRQGFEARP